MIVMLFQKNCYKEFALPNTDNSDYKLEINRNVFNVKNSFALKFEIINRVWSVQADEDTYQLIHHKKCQTSIDLCGNEIITLKTVNGEIIKILTFNSDLSLLSFDKYNISDCDFITIGKVFDNTISYDFMGLVSKYHCEIARENGRFVIYDRSSNGVFVNNKRIPAYAVLRFGDTIDIFGLKIIFLNDVIAVGSIVKKYVLNGSLDNYVASYPEEYKPRYNHTEIFFNRSPRIFPAISTEEVVIEAPNTPTVNQKRSLISTIGPSLTMTIPMLLGCVIMFIGGGSPFMLSGLITALGSGILGSFWAFMNIRESKKNEFEDETQRFNIYGNYLLEISKYIKKKYLLNYKAMHTLYPSANDCCSYNENSPELWNRNNTHNDFLFCRLGVGDIDFQVKIKVPQEKFSVVFDSLKDKPAMLYENFRILKDVPVGVDFSQSNLYGIVGGKNKAGVYTVINNIIAQVTANISYTDVKIAFCFDSESEDETERWNYIKWLPHLWSENRKMRYFATDKQEISDVFFELSNILRQRSEQVEKSYDHIRFKPHYFLFVSDASMFDGELISKYVFNEGKDLDFTTFIMTDFYQNLPNSCENIIQNDENFSGSYNVLDTKNKPVNINFDTVDTEQLTRFAKRLSNISVREVEDDNSIVNSLDFFEMYASDTLEDFRVIEQWRKNRTYNTMRALIGKKAGGADCYLDIHEKYHGPHGLVAGTTGSGKSELIQTLILSLAINYSPDDISFFIIDFKGGGMANLFSDLPHMAGQISNLSGNQIGRAMISIKSENLRRQKVFGEFGVNNINLYTRLYKSGEASVPIPHLLIVIDEFAELKKEEPEFMRELISVAQVGRSLGVHLILATQKPSGTVDDNIWSNAKFRLCLRVQDRQDSNDMLHTPDAAYITQAGRCYLQVGNNEIYELFQSGWSGAVYEDKKDIGKSDIATMITSIGKTAIVGSHTKMKRKEKEKKSWYICLLKCIFNVADSMAYDISKFTFSDINFSESVIDAVHKEGYNIGKSDADIRAVGNFIAAIPDQEMPLLDIVESVLEKSALNNFKLPEVKEKTQLEAIVEYLKDVADKNGYKRKTQLWMPLLKKEIIISDIWDKAMVFDNKTGWKKYDKWSISTEIGMYDDPQNQSQMPFKINFSEGGHLAVCGAVVSGKSTFLQTLIFSLAMKYSPEYLNFYILDFSSGMLSVFDKLPHTGGIIRENELDRSEKFFNMVNSIIEERKVLLKGGNYSQYVKVNGPRIPAVIIVIDNFASFKEKTENRYEEILINLSRDGVGYGVYLALSSAGFGMSEIQNRIGDNIRTVVSLEMSDKFKYMDVLRTTRIDTLPESDIKGRGIGFVDGRLLEFQTAVAVSAEDDYKRNSLIEKNCQSIADYWTGPVARKIPFIPENPIYDDIAGNTLYKEAIKDTSLIPIAYKYENAAIYSIELKRTYCYSVTGKNRTGKTNVLKLVLLALLSNKSNCVIIEKNSKELKNFVGDQSVTYLADDMQIFEYFKNLTDKFIERNKDKKRLEELGLSDEEIYQNMQKFEPIFILIADVIDFIDGIYKPDANVGNMSGFFENIFEKGYLHNIFFIGCINTDEAANVMGLKAYHFFTSYKTGIHLGGNVSAQRIFNFQNIHYTQMSKPMKKGEGLTPSADDETFAKKIIIPLVGGTRQ